MLDGLLADVNRYLHTHPWLALVAVLMGEILTASRPCVLGMIAALAAKMYGEVSPAE